MTIKSTLATCILSGLLFATYAQKEKPKWDVNNPPGTFKNVSFAVKEGTWMNVDVSPDGKDIVFDLLGDIYLMPVNGGEAKVLRNNHAFEVQPRFSPDGKMISFTSDAGGGDNIWVMDRDGSNVKQITKESFRLLNNAVWTPDGQYLIARKHFTSGRSLGAGELWLYHITGGGGLQLTARKNDQQDLNEPCVSSDGRYVYYSEDVYPGGYFQYNKDPNNQVFVIKRFDLERGVSETITGGNGSAARPQISHDGKTLAFIRRVRTKTVLFLRNMETAEEWPVYDKLGKDQMESWTVFGIYTGFSWNPDNKFIYIWSDGKIMKVDANAVNSATEIPFTANVRQKIYDAVRFKQNLNPDKFNVNVIRQATTSPDGKWMVFHAAGYLYKKELPLGAPQRITTETDFEFYPSFSPDGKFIAYSTWNDVSMGTISKVNFMGPAKPVKVSIEKGIYSNPSFSPDGKWIVYQKGNADDVLGTSFTVRPGIYLMDAATGKSTFVSEKGSSPYFNAKGDRIFYSGGGSALGSYKLDGADERQIFKTTYGSQFKVSPDGRWVAFIDLHKVYVGAFPQTGKIIDLNSGTSDFPVKQVAKDAGINLHWSTDGKQLHYTLGDQYFTINMEERFEFVAGKPDSTFKIPEKGIATGLELKTDKPDGTIAFTNARIITMNGNEVIENGTIVVEMNMIKMVGATGQVTIPASAKVIDCTGKTITPGFIDAHAHADHFRSGITPQKHWPYYTNMAYGVTAMHDPSANTEMVFSQSEMVKAGIMVGPRVFSTGTIIYGADGNFKAVINSLDDAKSHLARTKAFGAFSVKSYNQPRREQRQQVIQAARELNMLVVPEGGSFFYHNMSMILDGHTTIEHNIPMASIYDDVIQLWKQSSTGYTPTLIVNYGSVSGEYYWYQHTNVWEKERLLRFMPRSTVDTRSRHRTMLPEEEYTNGHIQTSKQHKKLLDVGVKVNSGAHGQLQGLGYHWEMWMMKQGGMTNHEVLKTATINPAQTLGFDDWIGTLQPGKLADLLVMDKNPLEDIYNTESIRYTMVNGRLYDADQMNETGNYNRPRGQFYWELNKNAGSFPFHEEAETLPRCSCGRH
jgi:imidazolonepropionase-like amidohydrolase/Tol biopolymer transport system component